MKEDGDLFVIGSSTNPDAVYKQACDEWFVEDEDIAAEEYPEFCLDICKKYDVDIFVPRRFLAEVAGYRKKFEHEGVLLFADKDAELIETLNDKSLTYILLKRNGIGCVPPYEIASSMRDFMEGYDKIKGAFERVCYKLVIDEGARSFRVIDSSAESDVGMFRKSGSKINLMTAKKILKEYKFLLPVMIMPYLDGTEISADCLNTPSGNIIIPRFKRSGRISEIVFDERVMRECGKIMDTLNIKMPLNIQFKMNDDNIYLLEINPRMSGGLQLSCAGTGINIPKIAVNQLMGVDIPWEYPKFSSRKTAHIETPICLD